jgi:hypothetical protein
MAGDRWRVHPGGHVPYPLAVLYANARLRVFRSPRLAPHLHVILSDGYADDPDHLRWVLRSNVETIESWARRIEEDSSDA